MPSLSTLLGYLKSAYSAASSNAPAFLVGCGAMWALDHGLGSLVAGLASKALGL